MKNDIIKEYNFNGNELTTWICNGKPWFYGSDVAEILGYKNTSDAIRRHVERNDQRTLSYQESRGIRFTRSWAELWGRYSVKPKRFISHAGVYALIESSKLPEADRFRHWLNHDVLPSISHNGYYVKDTSSAERLVKRYMHMTTGQALMVAAKSELARERDNARNKKVIAAQHSRIHDLDGQTVLTRQIEADGTSIPLREFGKELSQDGIPTGPDKIMKQLRAWGYLCTSRSEWNEPRIQYIRMGWFQQDRRHFRREYANGYVYSTDYHVTKVTVKGQTSLLRVLAKHFPHMIAQQNLLEQ